MLTTDAIYIGTSVVIAVCAVAGILVWGLRGKSKDDANAALVIENTSLRNQLGDKDKIISEKEGEIVGLKIRAEKSEKNEQYLKDLAQSKPDFGKLSVQLTDQHKQLLNTYNMGTNKMVKEISNLAKVIAKDRRNG